MPEVSVLLPCRNVAAWLPRCIESLEAQSLLDYEVLAVDDRSTDDTGALLRRWSARDGRVRVLETAPGFPGHSAGRTPEDGLVGALELAVAAASAPLLARMDGDDVAEPRRLELQRDFLAARPDLAGCGTAVELFPRSEVGEGYCRYETWLNGLSDPEDLWRDLLVECPVAHPTLMIRRSVLSGLGGYRDPGWPEDYDLVLRLHAAGMRIANLASRLVRWRGGLSSVQGPLSRPGLSPGIAPPRGLGGGQSREAAGPRTHQTGPARFGVRRSRRSQDRPGDPRCARAGSGRLRGTGRGERSLRTRRGWVAGSPRGDPPGPRSPRAPGDRRLPRLCVAGC